MKIIIDRLTGEVLYATALEFKDTEIEMAVDELITEELQNPYFDFITREFYEGKIII